MQDEMVRLRSRIQKLEYDAHAYKDVNLQTRLSREESMAIMKQKNEAMKSKLKVKSFGKKA